MIVERIIDLVLGVPAWLLGLFPEVELPAFFASGTGPGTVGGYVSGFAASMGSLSNIVPLDHAPAAIAIVGVSLAAALVIKLARIVASFLTAGGGSAA